MILASWGTIASLIRRADAVLEVVDARNPVSTRSKRLENLAMKMGKPVIIVLNKSDLIPREVAEEWIRVLRARGYRAVYMAATKHMGTRVLRREIKAALDGLKPAVVAVVGYPKTGKSSIINALKGRHSASTSPVPGSPGYTRKANLYYIKGELYLLDTPGVIPPDGSSLERVLRGAPPEKLKDPVKPALELIKFIKRYNPYAFKAAYGFDEDDPYKFLEELARRRGWFYKSTREPLVEQAARAVIIDYHKGKIDFYVPPSAIDELEKGLL